MPTKVTTTLAAPEQNDLNAKIDDKVPLSSDATVPDTQIISGKISYPPQRSAVVQRDID